MTFLPSLSLSCSFSQANHSCAVSITKNERFTQKTFDRIPNPAKNPCFKGITIDTNAVIL